MNTQTYSITNTSSQIETSQSIISQDFIDIVKHKNNKQYQLLSKNNFGKHPHLINIGFFNKKTNMIFSEDHSLMVFDKKTNQIITITIPGIQQEPDRYFLIYRYIFNDLQKTSEENDNEIEIHGLTDIDVKINIKLVYDLGYYFGDMVKHLGEYIIQKENIKSLEEYIESSEFSDLFGGHKLISNKEFFLFLIKAFIKVQNNKVNLNKNILLNSNPEFLLGFLSGFFKKEKYFYVPKTVNIYIFSTILNLLGASYSIRNSKLPENMSSSVGFIIRFKLPIKLQMYLEKENKFINYDWFRKHKYVFTKKEKHPLELELELLHNPKELRNMQKEIEESPDENQMLFINEVNSGNIELIPCTDIIFKKLDKKEQTSSLYDLVMENDDAHNFMLSGLPLQANSDGDIAGVIALFTKDGVQDGIRNFSPLNKKRFINVQNGKIHNYGVAHDGQLGLYNATK